MEGASILKQDFTFKGIKQELKYCSTNEQVADILTVPQS